MVNDGSTPILLIDSDSLEAMNIRYVFKSCGISGPLTHLLNAEEALLYLRKHNRDTPRLILLNLALPTMSACQFMESLQTDESFVDIPVILYGDSVDESMPYLLGAACVVDGSEDYEQIAYQLAEVVNNLVLDNMVAA